VLQKKNRLSQICDLRRRSCDDTLALAALCCRAAWLLWLLLTVLERGHSAGAPDGAEPLRDNFLKQPERPSIRQQFPVLPAGMRDQACVTARQRRSAVCRLFPDFSGRRPGESGLLPA
jgi:hypothetical protein